MFMEERQKDIIRKVNQTGRILVSEIQECYQISADCARRDLRMLERKGLLQRTYGGAIAVNQMKSLLEKYQYSVLTITLTGDYKVIYQRFLERENSPDRHRGHVENDCYPEKKENSMKTLKAKTISYENFVCGIEKRGFDAFCVDGKQIKVDITDFSTINYGRVIFTD